MDPGGTIARFPHNFRSPLGGWLVGTAREVSFLEADVAQHSLDQSNVLRLATVGRAGNGKLLIAPAECVESARGEKGEDLEGLGAGAPVRECVGVASCA